MNNSTKKLTLSAILSAISFVTLYLSCTLNVATLALLGVSTCLSYMTFNFCGKRYGSLHYIVVSILGLLLLPFGAPLLAYVAFLGYYPLIKALVKNVFIRIIIFLAVYVLTFLLFKNLLLPAFSLLPVHYVIGILGGTVVFLIFEKAVYYFDIFIKNRLSFLNTNK